MSITKKKERPHERVKRLFQQEIAEHLPGDSLGTEMDLVRRFEVARMTVRKAVDALIAEGRVERRPGIGLFVRKNDSVTRRYRFIAANIVWSSSIQVGSALRQAGQKIGSTIELVEAGNDVTRFLAEIRKLPSEPHLNGAIIFSQHGEDFCQAVHEVEEKGFPLVLVDQQDASAFQSICVASDNYEGGKLAARTFALAGHRRLAMIGDFDSDTVQARWEGFVKGAEEARIPKPQIYKLHKLDRLNDWSEQVGEVIERMLKLNQFPTAIFCSCDAVARHVARFLTRAGYNLPKEISLIGFDDDPISEWTTPALTTIRQDYTSMGEAALSALTRPRQKGPNTPILIPVQLIERDSVRSRFED